MDGLELYKNQEKQKDLYKQEAVEENAFKTGFKNESGTDGAFDNQEAGDFAKISAIPEPAANKNGGVFRFFKKKSLNDRNAPDGDNANEQQNEQQQNVQENVQQNVQQNIQGNIQQNAQGNIQQNEGQQIKRQPRYKRALVDLNDAERAGESVKMMRDSKEFLLLKTEADLKAKRDVPLSDFTKNILEKLRELGGKDASLFSDLKRKKKTFEEENAAAKECLPFLIKFAEDTEKLEADMKNVEFKNEYNKLYGHISEEEKNLLRIYAEHLRNVQGTLDTTGKKLTKVSDSKIGGPGVSAAKLKIGKCKYDKLSGIKFEDKKDVPLFAHQPNIYDMKQGNIGNCYLISSLVEIVSQTPSVINDCMKDNGDTVTVRFYHGGKPVYINVEKTVPYREYQGVDDKGNAVTLKESYGSKGALWVSMMEKAYAVFLGGNYHNLTGRGDEGSTNFIRHLTNRKSVISTGLAGKVIDQNAESLLPKKHSFKSLLHNMRKSEREEFEKKLRKEGKLANSKKERDKAWNREKAKMFFGIDSDKYDKEQLSEMFRKNTAFTKWREYFEKLIKKFTEDGLRTITEFQMVLSSIKKDELPKLNIPGVDEKTAQDTYISRLMNYLLSKKVLFSITDKYEYNDEEKRLYNRINSAKENKVYITTGTSRLRFEGKKKENFEGEQAGIFGNHAYAVLGTKEKEITVGGEKLKKRFVIVSNPWQDKTRIYMDTGVGYLQKSVEDDQGNTVYDNHGVFLVELREFHYTFSSVEFQ
ncbi:MAG: hypothetical protein IJ054_02035 [Lachnospiraceae bacterium]|nr:hypothetical protein [Lachnospiraceae bacterium]MBQ9608711.1 hypothetical protein [Lachnospiraceae bacterium]